MRKLDSHPAVPDRDVVVLGEHVDYWDGPGWRDRFSSRDFTERQQDYASRLHLESPYTPQIVIDGHLQMVGNDSEKVLTSLHQAASQSKADIAITPENLIGDDLLVKVEVTHLPANKHLDLYVAVADNADETQVGGGENSGRRLSHVAVARSLQKVSKLDAEGGTKEIKIRLPKAERLQKLRLVAFLQEPHNGAVLGSAVRTLYDLATR